MTKKKEKRRQPILVAVDFSDYSRVALLWAARVSKALDSPLLVLHVVHDPESAPGYYKHSKKWKKHLVRMEDAAEEMMEEFIDEMRLQHSEIPKLETRLVVGLPVTRILEMAKKINAQLIVMGSQGRTGLSHLLLGSKAEKVAQLASIPVTIVKSGNSTKDSN
jgi:nucleotide-binding universal stress UspA family protein